MTDVAVISLEEISEEKAPAIYVSGGLKPFIEQVRQEVGTEVPDLSTKKGRDRIASLAAKVSKSKVAVEKPGRDYLKKLKEMPKIVESELRDFVREMDALRDETRKPLTEWEDADRARVEKHHHRIYEIENLAEVGDDLPASGIQSQIEALQAIVIDESFEEFEAQAHRTKAESLSSLSECLEKRLAYEKEQAELARLREEQAKREQEERETRLVQEAEERARLEAEKQRETERIKAAEKELAAERERIELQRRAEQAERDAEAKAEAAAAAERKRYLDEQKELARQAMEREADVSNKRKVNRAAVAAFVDGGMTEECAKQAIKLIATKRIPAISISY